MPGPPDEAHPVPGKPLNIDDYALGWREAGSGDVVVFLHGLGGSRTAWEPQLEGLSDRWRCVAWDLPGYGRSLPIEPFTFEAIADNVARLLDVLGVARAHLCGLSFGGHHALHAALRHPDRVASLTLADTSAAFGLDGTDAGEWIRSRTDALDAGLTPADIAEQVIDSISGPSFEGRERERTIAAFGRIPAAGLRAACECLPSHDVRDRLRDIDAPTLVIQGELDAETPLPYAEMLASGIADARLHMIPGVGHLTPAESPEKFNAVLRSFLEGLR